VGEPEIYRICRQTLKNIIMAGLRGQGYNDAFVSVSNQIGVSIDEFFSIYVIFDKYDKTKN
jgi:hypothetical protein